jgi:hypothetical protein
MRRTAALLALAFLSACAKSPESIAPSYISSKQYMSWTCGDLALESMRVGQALGKASQQQENARTNDIVGVLLIGIPVSSLSGDNIAPEVARLKGESEAIRQATITKRCNPS